MNYENFILEWEGSASIFNDVALVDKSSAGQLEARILLSRRRTDLDDMIGRFSTALGFVATSILTNNPVGQAILAFCIIALVNPFKIGYLKGEGIDDLIATADFDDETGERCVEKRTFLKFCHENNISSDLLTWLEANGFVYLDDSRIVFRNSFKQGDVISTV